MGLKRDRGLFFFWNNEKDSLTGDIDSGKRRI
jgi:hypothetical protein